MVKRDYYYKFIIKMDRKLIKGEIEGIKEVIFQYLGEIPRVNIQGGEANNTGYYKFKIKNDNKIQQFRC
ncbi:hypothetical protein 15570_00017 [Lokiarchaeota virus WyrdV1]|nr:hypothetical protein 15570_00017 [Lokiarchaeota virus WyrdV1]